VDGAGSPGSLVGGRTLSEAEAVRHRVGRWVMDVCAHAVGGGRKCASAHESDLPGDRCPRVGQGVMDPTKINSRILSEPWTTVFELLHARWVYERSGQQLATAEASLGAVRAVSLELSERKPSCV